MEKRQYRKYTDEDVRNAIKDSYSWREASFKLGLNGNAGGNSKTLKRIAVRSDFDYSHFKGQGWNLGQESPDAIPLENLLKKDTFVRSDPLKKKLIKKGILNNQCFECGQLPIWNNKPLVLELDHIDGDNTNNELSNLRILCGHCHSQTPTFRGRNSRRAKKYYCNKCDKEITRASKSGLCVRCVKKTIPTEKHYRKVKNRPSREQLLKEVEETSYCSVGKKYGVSDTCIRKWINTPR